MRGPTYDRDFLVNKVAMMRIKGKSTYTIIEFLKDKVGMGQTTAYEVMRDAQKLFVELQKEKLEGAFEESISQLEELYESTSDKKLRLSIVQEMNKMKGLYAAQRVEHSGQVGFTGIDIQIVTNDDKGPTQSQE
jgi:fructosamine-3-kinase